MSLHSRSARRVAWFAPALLSIALLLVACSDDDGGGGDGQDTVMGEPCPQPGFTETGCTCDNGGMGSRTCSAEGVWSDCACRPPRGEFECDYEGQPIQCDPCPGEDEGRMTTCPASLMFDCSCGGQGQPGGMMDAGMGDAGMLDGGDGEVDAATPADGGDGSDDDGGADDDAG
jgi:hypothetical protein